MDADGSDRFFTVLLDDFDEKLTIPAKFVTSVIREQEWKAVKLRSSLGKIWTVELEEDADGYRFFGNGWKDFVQEHDLRFGYFLVFYYSDEMGFFVRVFDHSACLKRYCDFNKNENHVDVDDGAGEEDCEILEKPKDCKPEVIDLDISEEEHVMHHQQNQTEDKTQVDFSGKPKLSKTEYKPQFDFSGKPKFRVTMRAFDHHSNKSMHVIPSSFLDSNNLTGIRKATLSNSAGNWTVNVHRRLRSKRKSNEFGHGWLTFFKENKLKAGDVCIFELVSVTKDEAHFFVTREQDLIRTTSTSSKSKEKAQRTSLCPSMKRPYFTIVIKKCHLSRSNSYLHIPVSFSALDYLTKQPDVTLMDTDGKSWKMLVHTSYLNNKKYPRLATGWSDFCHDKKVHVGDVCTFELVSKGKKAKLFVDVQNKKQPLQSFNQKNKETSVVNITGDKRMVEIIDVENYEPKKGVRSKRRSEKQRSFSRHPKRQKVTQAKSSSTEQHIQSESSKKPQFIVTLRSHNFLRRFGSQLNVPKKFSGWKFFGGKCKVKLVNAKGTSWLVSICGCRGRIQFGAGWYLFACDNGLKVGDLCSFTLISKKDAVMRLDVLNKETNK